METALNRDSASDTDLMLAYQAGDIDSFDELYRRHRTPLYRFMVNSCSNEATAAELYQDVWARVVNGRHGYTNTAPFTAWLYRIARNRIIDSYRSGKSSPLHASVELNEESHVTSLQTPLQPDEVANLANREDALNTALASLPDDQREAVLLRHIAGFSLQEIAELVDENAETVKSRLRYAFTKLRKQLRVLA